MIPSTKATRVRRWTPLLLPFVLCIGKMLITLIFVSIITTLKASIALVIVALLIVALLIVVLPLLLFGELLTMTTKIAKIHWYR